MPPNRDRRRQTGHIPTHGHTGWLDGGLLAPGAVSVALGGDTGGSGSTGGAFSGAAADVTVADAAGYFAGGNVEAVLAELARGAAVDTSLNTVAASGATETLDVAVARTHDVTLTADCTFTFSGAVTAEAWLFTILLRQDGTGGWDVTWPASVVWPSGSAPTLDTTAGAEALLHFATVDGGTTWYGVPPSSVTAADISIADAGGYYTGTDVEAALQEIGAHPGDATDAHDASAVSAVTTGYTNSSGTDVQAVLDDFDAAITAAAATGSGMGGGVAFTIIGQEERISDGSTVIWTLDNDFEENSVSARNLTTGHVLSVTEGTSPSVTISAAGTAGDRIAFGYAASAI